MNRYQRITISVSVLVAIATMIVGYHEFPKATQPNRTNLIGPETRTVSVQTEAGPEEVTLELTAVTRTESIFAVEHPYRETAIARVRLVDKAPIGLSVPSLNKAVAGYVSERTSGSWLMDRLVVPQFAVGNTPTVVTTNFSEWLRGGVVANAGQLAAIGFVVGGLYFGLMLLAERMWRAVRPRRAVTAT